PTPPTATPRPDSLSGLRQFLAPEIAQGLVTVEGDAQRILVRIRSRAVSGGTPMFPSGSATLDPRFRDLMRRIGEGLKIEPGRVLVQGHSDNQPIRTVRFPSNFALSLARAQEAANLIIAANGEPPRFTVEGKADAEPIGPNTTPEGREENRRIEVILLRGGR
ncbi:MAG: hypothetical protein JWR00_795, partial [Rubritepida sp.]|nr:hypothetical protein [Rubritepida sp.]